MATHPRDWRRVCRAICDGSPGRAGRAQRHQRERCGGGIMRRRITAAAAIGLALIASMKPMPARAQPCETYRITGYLRSAGSAHTYDGTSIWTREPIVSASWNLPIDTYVAIDGLGAYR